MNIITIFDPDTRYTEGLTNGLNALSDFPYECFAFTTREALESFTREKPPVIILIAKTADTEKVNGAGKIYLTETTSGIAENEIYKYQRVPEIARKIEQLTNSADVPGNELTTLRKKLHEQVLGKLNLNESLSDHEILSCIDTLLASSNADRLLTPAKQERLKLSVFASLRKMDILTLIMEDPEITEIMVNGPKDIFIERKGKITRYPDGFLSEEKLNDIIQQMASLVNRRINEASPMVDARLPDGSRVNLVLPPVALGGPYMTIRRFPETPFTMDDLISFGSIRKEEAAYLKAQVQNRKNIFISGGTGSGKTTFLGALANFIPEDERIITVEDSAELQLTHIPNLVRLESRPANLEGDYAVTIRSLIRNSLRMRPDRLIVGEIRGDEALDMLTAMNTGHAGSLSTGHANSAQDMLFRIETMVLSGSNLPLPAIRAQIVSAIDLVIHLIRTPDGKRKLEGIYEMQKDERETPTLVRITF